MKPNFIVGVQLLCYQAFILCGFLALTTVCQDSCRFRSATFSSLWEKNEPLVCFYPAPDEVYFEDLSHGLKKGKYLLIDVRNQSELEDPGKIPGSFNVPLHEATPAFKMTEEEFYKTYGFKKPDPRDQSVVITCRSGKRAADFIDILRPLGYDNFKLYKGSFLDWVEKGGEVIKKPSDGGTQ